MKVCVKLSFSTPFLTMSQLETIFLIRLTFALGISFLHVTVASGIGAAVGVTVFRGKTVIVCS